MLTCSFAHNWAPVDSGPLSLPRRLFRSSVASAIAVPTAENQYSEVDTSNGKQQIVRQHPEPFADIERRKKGQESGHHVEIGQNVVEKLGKPYLPGSKITCIAVWCSRISQSGRLPCGRTEHGAISLPCRRSKL